MATRFYLPTSGDTPVTPSFSSDWEHQNGVRREMDTAKTNTTPGTDAYSPDAADHLVNADSLFCQYVSKPLNAQTISAQTVKLQIRGSETNNGNNCFITWKLFVCSEDGNTIKETLLAIRRDGLELTTSLVNRSDSATCSTATLEQGDRVVLEIGIGGTPTGAGGVQGHNGGLRLGDNNASDLPENDTDATDANPWLEFVTDTFSFVTPATPSSLPWRPPYRQWVHKR